MALCTWLIKRCSMSFHLEHKAHDQHHGTGNLELFIAATEAAGSQLFGWFTISISPLFKPPFYKPVAYLELVMLFK